MPRRPSPERHTDEQKPTRRDLLRLSACTLAGGLITAPASGATGTPQAGVRRTLPGPAGSAFPGFAQKTAWEQQGTWPASWIHCPHAGLPPIVTAYRLPFHVASPGTARIHVSADERYELFLDGKRVGRGSERGNLEHWFYETYEIPLDTGTHVFVARVWSMGSFAPLAQFTVRPGFLLAAEAPFQQLLSSGLAPWEAKPIEGCSFEPPVYVWGLSAPLTIDGSRFPWGFERGEGDGWKPAAVDEKAAGALQQYGIAPARYLRQATLPPMLDRPFSGGRVRLVAEPTSIDTVSLPVRSVDHLESEAAAWQRWLNGQALQIPAGTVRRVIVDLENYVCAYPELATSGGAGSVIRVEWAEALRIKPGKWNFEKGNRDEIEGKYFLGMGDRFLPDGGAQRVFTTLWWAAGRYVEIVVKTGSEPLVLESLGLRETRYPLEMETSFTSSSPEMNGIIALMVRGMQMCSHETYLDCPYFEQMQYVGDARVEALCNYVMTRDDRLPRKALHLIDVSRHAGGLTEARYPVREAQFIPWFSLIWVGMVHDYAMWRNDPDLVRSLMPGVRAVMDAFSRRSDAGLIVTPEGWNDTDSVHETGVSGLLNWQYVWSLSLVSELELWVEEPELSRRAARTAREMALVVDRMFWDEAQGLYADEPQKNSFSEPVQSMAVLSGLMPAARIRRLARSVESQTPHALFGRRRGRVGTGGAKLEAATVYSTHYLFEAYRRLGLVDLFHDRLRFWFELKQQGFRTPIESYEPSRSDCHAWGSHPLYHYFATVLGIRPSAPGFARVEIAPALGPLSHASGRLVHPAGGEIVVDFEKRAGKLRGRIGLPAGVSGEFKGPAGSVPLKPGDQDV